MKEKNHEFVMLYYAELFLAGELTDEDRKYFSYHATEWLGWNEDVCNSLIDISTEDVGVDECHLCENFKACVKNQVDAIYKERAEEAFEDSKYSDRW